MPLFVCLGRTYGLADHWTGRAAMTFDAYIPRWVSRCIHVCLYNHLLGSLDLDRSSMDV